MHGRVHSANDGRHRHFTTIIELGAANHEFHLHGLSVPEVVDAIISLTGGFDLDTVTVLGKSS